MTLVRNTTLILLALFIDGLQAGLGFGIIGASSIVAWIPFLGQAIAMGGYVMSIAINTCLSFVFGAGLVTVLFFAGVKPQRKLPWGLGELIPGINNIPFWTFLTAASLWADATKPEGGVKKGRLHVAGLPMKPGGAAPAQKNTSDTNFTPQAFGSHELTRESEKVFPQRTPLQDIRSVKPHVKTT